jgi:hypothetical protein
LNARQTKLRAGVAGAATAVFGIALGLFEDALNPRSA